MMYFAVGLAVVGAVAGLAFRWKVLLPIIVLLPFAAIILSVSRDPDLKSTVITVLVAEAILQGGYCVGLLIRFIASTVTQFAGTATRFKGRRVPKTHDNDRHPASPATSNSGAATKS